MATVTIRVPDDLLREARACAFNSGHLTIEEFLVSALHALTHEGKPLDAATEQALMAGLESPLEEMTDADWQALRERAKSRRKRRA